MLAPSTRTRMLTMRSPSQHARGKLAEHRGIDGGGHVADGETEALRGEGAHPQAQRGTGEDEAVENVHHSLDLLELLGDLASLAFNNSQSVAKDLHFDRLRRPGEIADEVGENSREFPFDAGYGDVEPGAQLRDPRPGCAAAGRA